MFVPLFRSSPPFGRNILDAVCTTVGYCPYRQLVTGLQHCWITPHLRFQSAMNCHPVAAFLIMI